MESGLTKTWSQLVSEYNQKAKQGDKIPTMIPVAVSEKKKVRDILGELDQYIFPYQTNVTIGNRIEDRKGYPSYRTSFIVNYEGIATEYFCILYCNGNVYNGKTNETSNKRKISRGIFI